MSDGEDTGWGSQLTTQTVRGVPVRVYHPRRQSLLAVLAEADRWGDCEFLVDEGRRITFEEFAPAVDRAASRLVDEGVRRDDRVMLLAQNSVEWIVSFWATLRLGAVIVLGNAWWSEGEILHAVELIEAHLVIVDDQRSAKLPQGTRRLAIAELSSTLSSTTGGTECRPLGDLSPPVDEDDPAVIVFTSGTTGAPKAAVLSHRSVIANQHNFLARTRRLPSPSSSRAGVRSLLSTPLFHTGGVQAFMSAMVTGGCLVFLIGRFDPRRILELIERERVTVWAGVPTMLQRVLDHPDAANRDLTSLRGLGLGGAPLPAGLLERAATALPNVRSGVSTNYGTTEAGGIVAAAAGAAVLDHPGTSGRPLDAVELRIDGAEEGKPGEILIRSASLFSGYWRDPETPIDQFGWLHTGDIGRLDEDGFLYVVDRIKDVVIRGGENIASPHVEFALMEHPRVRVAAVIGLPHRDLGEEVGAVVVVDGDAPPTARELAAHAATLLAHFEVPTRWWITTDPLPETHTGKVNKSSLRATWPADV